MEWQQIIGFYHVAKLKSLTRAAEATYRTQSALTQQIKALESDFDCQLFERIGKRKIILASVGERFFKFAESVLINHQELRNAIAEHKGLKRGRLTIAAPFTTLYHLLPEIVWQYSREFPWVELALLDRPQTDLMELVKSGDIDFGIALESVIPRQLNKRRWKKVEPFLLVQSGHPLTKMLKVTLDRIAEYPLILPPKDGKSLHRIKVEELFHKQNLKYIVVMESSNVELSSLYAELGIGVSFASVAKDLPAFRKRKIECVSLCHILNSEYICIATRKDKQLTSYQKAFLNMLFDI